MEIITSSEQFERLRGSSRVLIVDFHAEWCTPCKIVSPIYEKMAKEMGSPGKVTFAKCDVDKNQQIAAKNNVTAMPTFLMFRDGKEAKRIQGANVGLLQNAAKELAKEAGPSPPSGSGEVAVWIGNEVPKPYSDVTGQTDLKQLDLLNSTGNVRALFDNTKPSQASPANSKKGKGKGAEEGDGKTVQDWVESDTDEQLMLFISFNSIIKVHTIQITSLALPPRAEEDGDDDDDDDEVPSRPGVLKIWVNHPQILSFDEGEDKEPTQLIELKTADWNPKSKTISVPLRFVKFQSVSTINILFMKAEKEDAEKVRVDRIRIIGGTGEKKEMGKLEKIGDLSGE